MFRNSDSHGIIPADESTASTSNSLTSQADAPQTAIHSVNSTSLSMAVALSSSLNNDLPPSVFDQNVTDCEGDQQFAPSLAAMQLSKATLQILEPPLLQVKGQLKELIGRQNKIYIDLSAEKYKFENAEVAKLQEMMNNVKTYREKLLRIKKQMQNIYQRTNMMKKRAANIEAYKQKELQRKLKKQQQEEALIGKKQQQ